MESVEIYVEIFYESWKNNDNLVRILKNTADYLSNVSENQSVKALELIFDDTKGLFRLIERILCMSKIEMNNFASSLKESFIALQFIMEYFQQDFEPYILKARNKCFECIKTICWFYARRSAGDALRKLIELFPDYDLELDEIISHYNHSYLRTYKNKRDGSILFIVIGGIAKYCPKTKNLLSSTNSIFLELFNCLKQLQSRLTSEKQQPAEVKIYLECTLDMLTNFVPYEDQVDKKLQSQYFKNMYDWLLIMSKLKSQKAVRSKALEILTSYTHHFSIFILSDYKEWHELFNKILEEGTNHTIFNSIRSFYNMMASELLKEDQEMIFIYFKNYFEANLLNENLPLFKLNLTIYGFGEFSIAYKKYFPAALSQLFQNIALQASSFYEKNNEINLDAQFLKTLSQILRHMSSVSMQHVSMISQFSVNFIKKFPESTDNFIHELPALKKTFSNMSQLSKNYQDEYFNLFFHKGILLSCSHTLLVDVELQQELQNLSEKPICYKNYVPLWNSLFTISNDAEFSKPLTEEVFNKFSSVILSFIENLNLNVKIEEEVFFITTSYSLKTENDSDFRFFINLIDLYIDVFEKVESNLFQNWIDEFLLNFIKFSYKHPLISGFYKLIEVIFKKSEIFSDHEMYFSNSTIELISQYVLDVIQHISEFVGELQIACINLIFSTPLAILANFVNDMIPVFKIAFNIGLTNLSLAFLALDVVDKIVKFPRVHCSYEFLINIISFTSPFLSSEENILSFIQDPKKKKIETSDVFKNYENLENLQTKVLIFYGSLDSKILFDFLHEKSINTNATWNKKNLIQCELLFPDIRLEINFDKFIPRIIELTNSGDQRTKISACELLHSIITIILGKKLMDQSFSKSICYTILRLGCDVDDPVRLLYHPLVLQLTHYLSSKFMKDSRVSQDFIDTLFDGLTEEFNPLLRDYCGFYLKEFIQWSVQQSEQSELLNVYVKSVIRRIINFALYPSNKKRLAAAIAFNHLYKIFRENVNIIDIYWLEFFHAFIKSMEECDNIQIHSAISHVEKVMQIKATLFNANSKRRRVPLGFSNETLNGLLTWLFKYCGSAHTKCRWKCIEIFNNLYSFASNREFIENNLKSITEEIISENFNEIFVDLTIYNAKIFLRSLDFYIWIIANKFLSLESLEKIETFLNQKIVISKYLTNFIFTPKDYMISNSSTESNNAKEDFVNLKNEINLKILEYVATILSTQMSYENISWTEHINKLIIYCTLSPWKVGFTPTKLLDIEKLPGQIEKLLINIVKNVEKKYVDQLKNDYLSEIKKFHLHYMKAEYITKNKEKFHKVYQFFEGLFILQKCNFLNLKLELNITNVQLKTEIESVFEILKIEVFGNDSCNILDHKVQDNLNKLMKFLLGNSERVIYDILVKLIFNDNTLITVSGSKVSHGEYFLQNFKESIFGCMLESPIELMKVVDDNLIDNTDKILILVEQLLTFAHDNKLQNSAILADLVIKHFGKFFRILNDFDSREARFLSINRIAVVLQNMPLRAIDGGSTNNDLYSWILDRLTNTENLGKKTIILQDFLTYMVDDDSNDDTSGLFIVIKQLRNSDSVIFSQELKFNETLKFQVISCFQVLLKILVAKKSTIIYKIVINFCAGICKFLLHKSLQEHLNLYFCGITAEHALKSLNLAFEIFNNLNSAEDKLDVLKYFLLPSIELGKPAVVQEFYDENSEEMISMIKKPIDNEKSNSMDRKKLLVTKKGFYNLFELLYAQFELKFKEVGSQKLDGFLVKQALELRNYSHKNQEEKEIVRQLQCAAFNCCISVVSLKKEEDRYKFIFMEDRKKGLVVWEKIIDCEVKYDFNETSSTIRKNRKKLINIRKMMKGNENTDIFKSPYQQFDLTSLSLIENLHAYDLNDLTVSAKSSPDSENRLNLSFENDELNDHECMPMICGLLIHIFNNEITKVPSEKIGDANLPKYLLFFRNSFLTEEDNVRLYLMKIISNTKNAFLPFIKMFFGAIVMALCNYLKSNYLNYIVRDIVVIIIESEFKLTDDKEKMAGQALLERLIDRANDSHLDVYKYHLELIESLCKLWIDRLECPSNLEDKIKTDPNLAVQIILIFLKSDNKEMSKRLIEKPFVYRFVKSSINDCKNDNESVAIVKFETMGWIFRNSDVDWCRKEVPHLVYLMTKMINSKNYERCAKCVCALYQICPSKDKCGQLCQFARPRMVPDNVKPNCLELVLLKLPEMTASSQDLSLELTNIDLELTLRQRLPGCEGPALKIVLALAERNIVNEDKLQSLVQLVISGFTGPTSTLRELRRLAYSVLMKTYERFPAPNHALGCICVRALIKALDDPEEELQEFVLSFWRDSIILPDTSSERLAALLELYTSELHESFARFICLMMLELTSKSMDANRVMFTPLTDCSYWELQLLVPRRRMNWGSMAPLFVPSLASQFNQFIQQSQFSQQPESSSQYKFFSNSLRLLATKELEFEPTPSASSRMQAPQNYNFSRSKLPDPSQNKLSKRIVKSTYTTIKETFQTPSGYSKKLKNEIINRQKSVKIHRKYRNGDFPDVEITHESFVKCLKQLIINDWLSCKNLVITIVCSLINRLKGSNKYCAFKNTITKVFEKILQEENDQNNFAATILEIIYESKVIKPEPKSVTKICNEMGLESLGVLLLEDVCMQDDFDENDDGARPSKIMRRTSSEPEKWIQLATLYKKIRKYDVVTSIFRYKNFFSKSIQEGVLAQANNEWKLAKEAFHQDNLILEPEKDYCLQSLFECMSQLMSWEKINEKILSNEYLQNDLNSVWEHPKRKQLLPWIFQANLHCTLDNYTSNEDVKNISFIENIESWISSRATEIKQDFGEELSIFYSCDKNLLKKSRFCLKSCLDYLRNRWLRLSPLAEVERRAILLKLQRIYNIHTYLKIPNSTDFENDISYMLHYWEQQNFSDENLLHINQTIFYRLTFGQLLLEELSLREEETPEFRELSDKITLANLQQRIMISKLAIKNKNRDIARKHISQAEIILGDRTDLRLVIIASKYKFISGQLEKSDKRKYKYFLSALQVVKDEIYVKEIPLDDAVEIKLNSHLFDVTLDITKLIEKNPEIFMTDFKFISSFLNLEADDHREVLKALRKYSFNCLKNSCELGNSKKIAKTHVKFGKYCYNILTLKEEKGKTDFSLFKEFMSSILTGMSFGSLDAAYYFPCLLKYQYYQGNEEMSELFLSKTKDVPSWLFLSWQTQIMSFLGQPLAYIVTPIIERLIIDYPNGVMFNFRQVYKTLPELKLNPDVCRMYNTLVRESKIDDFFEALHRVCQPEYFLRYHILELLQSLSANSDEESIDTSSLDIIFSSLNQKSSFHGPVYNELEKYRKDYLDSTATGNKITKKKLCIMADNLDLAMKERLEDKKRIYQALQMKDYSPYLNNFSGENLEIEIPGQYDGYKKPMPQYHVKISKFDRFVTVMESKCFPVKINIIGNDANVYGFLVKFGEDLRQDQRLQQIFKIINKTLISDQSCKQRHLSINTYHVTPLSTSLGLIQWIDQTKSLREFIEFTMPNKQILKETTRKYHLWIEDASETSASKKKYSRYTEALIKYTPQDVVTKMNEFINCLDSNYLKNTFLTLSSSLECFVFLRQNFITNYATMCIVHWITGVGDRHLENMLIEVKTAKCYGIDFGLAFGAGIDQTPPELVPFRLTPQILELLKPFDENALLGATMTRVLNSLREERNRLLACFDIFIQEPLNWSKHINERIRGENEPAADVKWFPKEKIKIIKKKLSGIKPTIITCQELSYMHDSEMETDDAINLFSYYTSFINGTDPSHTTMRATMKENDLSSDEQVQCLLDQAKDLNLLGRMFVGWQPFV